MHAHSMHMDMDMDILRGERFSSQNVNCLVSGGWVIVHSLRAYPAAIIAFWTQYNGAGGGASACVRHVSVRNGRRGVSLQRARLVSGETVSTLPCFPVQGCLPPHRRSRALSVVVVFYCVGPSVVGDWKDCSP